jgi:hypothetical protein
VFLILVYYQDELACLQDVEEIDWEEFWNPRLFVENEYGEAKESVWYSLSFDDLGLATVCEKRRLNGSFLEHLELNQFPFDTQVSPSTNSLCPTEN